MAEGAPLLRVYTLIAYRGFESLLLRHIYQRIQNEKFGEISSESDENNDSDV